MRPAGGAAGLELGREIRALDAPHRAGLLLRAAWLADGPTLDRTEACAACDERFDLRIDLADLLDHEPEHAFTARGWRAPADLSAVAACPSCAHPNPIELDPAALLVAAADRRALRLTDEVAVLAAAWGWTPKTVLGLSERSRERYLALARG